MKLFRSNRKLDKESKPLRWPLLAVCVAVVLTATVGCYYYPEDFLYPGFDSARYYPAPSYGDGYRHAYHKKHKHPKYKRPKYPKYKKGKHHPHRY